MRESRSIATPGFGSALGAAILGVSVLGGCVVTDQSEIEAYGVPIGTATLERIPEGPSGSVWLEAAIGPPDARIALDDPPGAERWVWEAGTLETGSGSLLIFSGDKGTDRRVVTEVVVADGRVLETTQRTVSGPIGTLDGPEADDSSAKPAG